MERLQNPINSQNDWHIFGRQTNGVEHQHQSHKAGLRNPSRANWSCCCSYTVFLPIRPNRKWNQIWIFNMYLAGVPWLIFCFRPFTYLTAITLPNDNGIPRNWAIKIAATASYKAVPSMFIVAPKHKSKWHIKVDPFPKRKLWWRCIYLWVAWSVIPVGSLYSFPPSIGSLRAK